MIPAIHPLNRTSKRSSLFGPNTWTLADLELRVSDWSEGWKTTSTGTLAAGASSKGPSMPTSENSDGTDPPAAGSRGSPTNTTAETVAGRSLTFRMPKYSLLDRPLNTVPNEMAIGSARSFVRPAEPMSLIRMLWHM
ncbi:hypothetical protein [Vulgatibacter incomptus]|uniref:hypothetical protein n=1 Tax=Vulgatibacter incomptus TaxID=1391653 RepID=UPI001F0A932D|nr:hypothetical protein [Vulgatibacter incomptus]